MRKNSEHQRRDSAQFVDVFAINKNDKDSDSDRELYDEEKNILQQFEENDKELEEIAAQIVDGLDKLKVTSQSMEENIKRQGEMLGKTRAKSEKNEARLRQNNNQLKQLLNKYRNGKQICMDMLLCLIFLGLLGVLLKMMQSKGFI